ncbi:hypothetical protein D3C72_2060800 [compost metagenome]
MNARLAIFRRPSDEPEARNHIAVDDIVVGAAGDVSALARQDLEAIAVITFIRFGLVQLGLRKIACGTVAIPLLCRPIETIRLPVA